MSILLVVFSNYLTCVCDIDISTNGIQFTQVLELSSESHFVSCQHVCICIYHLSIVNMCTKEIKFKPTQYANTMNIGFVFRG